MNIAAELRGTELTVFIEGSNWKKTTQSFNKEMVKVGLIVYIIERERIFHDAVSREEATTHPSLTFCLEELTLKDLKKKLKKIPLVDLDELLSGSVEWEKVQKFFLEGEFDDEKQEMKRFLRANNGKIIIFELFDDI